MSERYVCSGCGGTVSAPRGITIEQTRTTHEACCPQPPKKGTKK